MSEPVHVHVVWEETDLPCPMGDPEECPHPAVRCTGCGLVVDLLESPDPREEW